LGIDFRFEAENLVLRQVQDEVFDGLGLSMVLILGPSKDEDHARPWDVDPS